MLPAVTFLAADCTVLLHFAFILFVSAGGLFVLRWPRLAWLHLPCAAWGVLVELTGGTCPLTPLELWLRRTAGDPAPGGDFIARYLLPLIYPADLDRDMQMALGMALLLGNVIVYGIAWHRRSKRTP
jgi:hypothetical protein